MTKDLMKQAEGIVGKWAEQFAQALSDAYDDGFAEGQRRMEVAADAGRRFGKILSGAAKSEQLLKQFAEELVSRKLHTDSCAMAVDGNCSCSYVDACEFLGQVP